MKVWKYCRPARAQPHEKAGESRGLFRKIKRPFSILQCSAGVEGPQRRSHYRLTRSSCPPLTISFYFPDILNAWFKCFKSDTSLEAIWFILLSLKCSTDCLTLDDLFGSPVAKATLFVPGHYSGSVILGVWRTVNVTTQKHLRKNNISCFYKQFFPVPRLVFSLSQILSGINNPARFGGSTLRLVQWDDMSFFLEAARGTDEIWGVKSCRYTEWVRYFCVGNSSRHNFILRGMDWDTEGMKVSAGWVTTRGNMKSKLILYKCPWCYCKWFISYAKERKKVFLSIV